MLENKRIAFIGAGSMAEAMIAGIVQSGKIPANQIIVSNRSNRERLIQLEEAYGINGVTSDELQHCQMDMIILAMKPKDAETALQSIRDFIQPHHIILSVLAGITTSFIENFFPTGQQVIRVMPNTSSMIRESATGISSGKYTLDENMVIAEKLLESIGKVYRIPEDKMDIFTGLAGSGPAYFYYLMEHMEKQAANDGLSEATAREIIAQTILGAAKMIQNTKETPTVLRKKVTSPNGTTAAGLQALHIHGAGTAIEMAISEAAERSHEITTQLVKIRIPTKQNVPLD
ncbi:pyrroline-5-carboxylate reductase [Bacillus tuaregi]|uniref:pyrroline-5-carboxylate reductase n=1 Tax=Bacillus tuaregi TaxID=1816695 RepID=UPI0008F87A17|nr:pyrroline-5-carboxylate reductase [Bacillus tuaregi]